MKMRVSDMITILSAGSPTSTHRVSVNSNTIIMSNTPGRREYGQDALGDVSRERARSFKILFTFSDSR